MKRTLLRFLLSGLALATGVRAAPAEFFVLWQGSGAWQCTLTIEGGTIARAEPYMFLDARDRIERSESQSVVASTNSRGNAAGLHVFVTADPNCSIRLATNRSTAHVLLADFPAHDAKIVPVADGKGFLLFGRGDPAPGPQDHYRAHLPETFVPPTPRSAIALPAEWWRNDAPVRIIFKDTTKGELRVRRVARNDGRLYLEVFSPSGPLKGKAEIALDAKPIGSSDVDGSLWLSLEPRIGRIAITLASPAGTQNLSVPSTLVETRGNRLFLNGEPFLIKGTLPGDLTSDDAEFIHGLGMNTLRGGAVLKHAEHYGFMAIASIPGQKLRKLSDYRGPRGRDELERDLPLYYRAKAENGRAAADSPYTLVTQLDNERTEIGANPLDPETNNVGADPWSDFLQGEESEFAWLDRILAESWNLVKPMAPTLPLGYANETQGYIAPAFLDVYMHNSYLPRDRYGIPFKEFSRLQGGERRPFINTEWGANRFTPESYHGAKNSPVLEKIQAWGYRQTWNAFMDAGTVGGTSYRLYDGTGEAIQGTKNFGIMTADHQPKLACWELWHLWRDFEIAPAAGNAHALAVHFKRDYAARDCRLTIQRDGGEWSADLGEVIPNSERTVTVPFAAKDFHWRVEYSTHHGLKMVAAGAWPAALEEADFSRRLVKRDAPEFLGALLTARVLTVEGRDAPPALVDMASDAGVIPLAFKCANGDVYVTAFSRRRAGDAHYVKADIRTAFAGQVVQVDEWTGKPTAKVVPHESAATGIVFKGVDIPIIPGPIGKRSNVPLSIPVFRIQPIMTGSNAAATDKSGAGR
jgi:hypothetical protein